jgi:HAE1 family hydrophobic/amphiphilic exporter-1
MSAVAGLERLESTSAEGSSRVTLNFAWGTDLNEAADDVRNRLDRVRGRLPQEADAPIMFKFDANATPIMGVGVEGDFDRVTLREMGGARFVAAPGARARRRLGQRRRRAAPPDPRRALQGEDSRARPAGRSRHQPAPLGESEHAGRRDRRRRNHLPRSQPGPVREPRADSRHGGHDPPGGPRLHEGHRRGEGRDEDLRAFTRINGRPGIRMRVTKQSGQNTVEIADAVRAEIVRINREMPSIRMSVLDDSSIFIKRSISAVKEAAILGAVLVIAIIFLFLRNVRSTVIICTSIPISIIGTFALLYFAGFTLNTMTFGGLALGVGMIVDASIVVLENTFRHMEHGKDRMQAAIDGSEEVWSAILASTLTHIAVFVPLLFLTGVSSILFKQLSVVVMFSLTMSLFVAVTIVPVLCSRLLKLPPPVDQRTGLGGRLYTSSERFLNAMDDGYSRMIGRALHHRPTVIGTGVALVAAAFLILPTIGFELMPATDEGEVTVNAELPVGTRIERAQEVAQRLESLIPEYVKEADTVITNAGSGGGPMGGSANRTQAQIRLVPKDQRQRSSEEIATALNRQLTGVIPGVIIQTRASGGNQQMTRLLSGGQGDSRLSVEVRGDDLAGSAAGGDRDEKRHGRRPRNPQRAHRPRRRAPGARAADRSAKGGGAWSDGQ